MASCLFNLVRNQVCEVGIFFNTTIDRNFFSRSRVGFHDGRDDDIRLLEDVDVFFLLVFRRADRGTFDVKFA